MKKILSVAVLGLTGCFGPTPEQRKFCETPELITQVDDVELWRVYPGCGRAVYFSKLGTDSTHLEQQGKTQVEIPDHVPATGRR